MSGWDWLHAGLEVATYAKAREAQQNLAAMKSANEIEAGRKILIEAMRGFIFDISRDIQLAEENISEHPQQVYIIAKSLEWRLTDSGLSPEVFPEFSDKEYVHSTQKKINNVISSSKSKLKPGQLEQSDIAIKYIAELPLLQQVIGAKSSLEQIQATEPEWKELESRSNSSKTKRNFGFLGLFGSPCLCFLASSTNDSTWLIPFIFILFLGALALLFAGGKSDPKYTELKNTREGWQKNLLPVEDWQRVKEQFGGDFSSTEFQKSLDDRVAFLKPVLGDEFQNFLNPKNN